MLKAEIRLGDIYRAKISNKLVRVRIDCPCQYGGWFGTNLDTGREVRIRSAAKLRYVVEAVNV